MNKSDIKKGMRVMFGRGHGEQTIGEVMKVNPVKVMVVQVESRGVFRKYPIGTVWAIPTRMVHPCEKASANVGPVVPVGDVHSIGGDGGPQVVESGMDVVSAPTPKLRGRPPRAKLASDPAPALTKAGIPRQKPGPKKGEKAARMAGTRPEFVDPKSGLKIQGDPGETISSLFARINMLISAPPVETPAPAPSLH